MIALDTNILVYAHRTDSPFHAAARDVVERLADGTASWAIPRPCAHEFLAVITHARIFKAPMPLETALPHLRVLDALEQSKPPNAKLTRGASRARLLQPQPRLD